MQGDSYKSKDIQRKQLKRQEAAAIKLAAGGKSKTNTLPKNCSIMSKRHVQNSITNEGQEKQSEEGSLLPEIQDGASPRLIHNSSQL